MNQNELPHSDEAESGILSSAMIDARVIPRIASQIGREHFYVPRNQIIFESLVERQKKKLPSDLITFCEHLRKEGLLDAVGGDSFITDLWTYVPTASNVQYYVDIVVEKYQLRQIITGCTEAAHGASQEAADVQEIKRRLWERIRNTESRVNKSLTRETVKEVRQMVYARQVGGELGIKTGIAAWDDSLGGILSKRFYVIGARPKVGKSSALEQIVAFQIAQGIPVLIFQRDMSLTDMLARMACRQARVIYQEFLTGSITGDELKQVSNALDGIDDTLLRIYSPSNMTADEVCSIIEREIVESKIKIFYMDLFQRLKTGRLDKVEGLTMAADAIRNVIQSTNVPGVVIAEILKEADQTKRPHSGQFKYCDGLFSTCDVSIMLWSNDNPRDLVDPKTGIMRRQKVIFTVDANRAGSVGDHTLYFDRPSMTFYGEDTDDDL